MTASHISCVTGISASQNGLVRVMSAEIHPAIGDNVEGLAKQEIPRGKRMHLQRQRIGDFQDQWFLAGHLEGLVGRQHLIRILEVTVPRRDLAVYLARGDPFLSVFFGNDTRHGHWRIAPLAGPSSSFVVSSPGVM